HTDTGAHQHPATLRLPTAPAHPSIAAHAARLAQKRHALHTVGRPHSLRLAERPCLAAATAARRHWPLPHLNAAGGRMRPNKKGAGRASPRAEKTTAAKLPQEEGGVKRQATGRRGKSLRLGHNDESKSAVLTVAPSDSESALPKPQPMPLGEKFKR